KSIRDSEKVEAQDVVLDGDGGGCVTRRA
ncbi:hypothetical protein L195_g044879, partial [Trifolium pratense]